MTRISSLVAGPSVLPVINLRALRADPAGVVDCSSILDAAEAIYSTIIVPPGEYLVDTSRTWSSSVTYIFQGGRFLCGTGRQQSVNSTITAGPRDYIFGGDIIQSDFISDVAVPYTLGWQGEPKGDVPTPFWFGAKADYDPDSDTGTDDVDAINAARFFGLVTYSPAGRYKTSGNLIDKRNHSYHYGDGAATRYYQRGTGPSGTGHLFALSALNGGVGIKESVIERMWGDNDSLTNENLAAMGSAEGTAAKVERCRIDVMGGRVGRQAATMQYRVEDSYIRVVVEDAATEASTTRYIANIEGIPAENGEDMRGNKIEVVARSGAFGGAQIYNAVECEISLAVEEVNGDSASGGGVLARLRGVGRGNKIVAVAETVDGAVAAVDSGQTDYNIDVWAKTVIHTSGTTGGRPFILDGPNGDVRIRIDDHQDIDSSGTITGSGVEARIAMATATTGAAINVTGTDITVVPEIDGLSCANGVVILNGVGSKCLGGYVTRGSGLKGVRLVATDCTCTGTTIRGDGAEAIRVESTALRPNVQGNQLVGTNPEVTALFTAASTGVVANNVGDVGTGNKFMRLGNYAIWIDSTGDLRINNGAPATDTSGTVVGTQS